MRKKEKEITDKTEIESIILRSSVCRLALSEDNQPYIIPLCFGYEENTLYFHSALEGKKLGILRSNNKVCFEFDSDHRIVEDRGGPRRMRMEYELPQRYRVWEGLLHQ